MSAINVDELSGWTVSVRGAVIKRGTEEADMQDVVRQAAVEKGLQSFDVKVDGETVESGADLRVMTLTNQKVELIAVDKAGAEGETQSDPQAVEPAKDVSDGSKPEAAPATTPPSTEPEIPSETP